MKPSECNTPFGEGSFAWDCAIGTPEEDHDWRYDGGDESVGVPGAWICRQCGKVDESGREPPSYDDDY